MTILYRTPVLLVAALPVLCSCYGSGPDPAAILLTSQPQWEWQSACCGIAGDTRTPSTEGYVYLLEFTTDGRVRATRDDDLVIETGYRVTRSPGGPTADQSVTVQYDAPLPLGPGIESAPGHLVVLQENGTLLLRNLSPCVDCYSDWRFLPRLVL